MKVFFIALLLLPMGLWAHTEKLEEIEVTHGKTETSLGATIPNATVLKEKQILKRRETTVGDTLKNEVGIQSTSFGPSSSRPVIRGLDGNRIRILQNGLGTLDASSQSVDHAIPIDTLTIDKIEVVRGPMALLYGSGAVGGLVNIVSNRIHSEYSEGAVTQVDGRWETVNKGLALGNRIDYGAKDWMFHFDGSLQNQGDTKIPGYAHSEKFRQTNAVNPEPKDKLPNSYSNQNSFAVGASKIMKKGYAGLSYYRFNNEYGSIAEPDVAIRMAQNRIEFASEYRPDSGTIKNIKFRSAQSFYKHEELEGNSIGTTFNNTGNESRLEFHTGHGKLTGISGFQGQINTFKAAGSEAFLPTTDNLILSVFTLQKLSVSAKDVLEAGARLESTDVKKKSSSAFGSSDQRTFIGMNGSLGWRHELQKNHMLNASYSYTERAPTFQELYASGAHVATGVFEQGDSGLRKERSHAFELNYKKDEPSSVFSVAAYTQLFHDFIVLSPSGNTDAGSGFGIQTYEQKNAILYGAELQSLEEITHSFLGGSWWWETKADYVRGKQQNGDNLPRMPSGRLSFGLNYKRDRWEADAEIQHYFEQTKTAANENKNDPFNLVNAGVIYELPH
jgi:iron complex outermembrane receptor protein